MQITLALALALYKRALMLKICGNYAGIL